MGSKVHVMRTSREDLLLDEVVRLRAVLSLVPMRRCDHHLSGEEGEEHFYLSGRDLDVLTRCIPS